MLSGKQRSYLRGLANTLPAIFQIGKGGVNLNIIKQFDDALEARELVKSTVLKNAGVDTREVCEGIAKKTSSEIVQVIGGKFILYRESKDKKVIQL